MWSIYKITNLHKQTQPKAGKQITYFFFLLLGLLLSCFEICATSQLLRGNETNIFLKVGSMKPVCQKKKKAGLQLNKKKIKIK